MLKIGYYFFFLYDLFSGFKELLKYLEPRYIISDRIILSRTHIKSNLKKILKNNSEFTCY